jgi:hypothetical protein
MKKVPYPVVIIKVCLKEINIQCFTEHLPAGQAGTGIKANNMKAW